MKFQTLARIFLIALVLVVGITCGIDHQESNGDGVTRSSALSDANKGVSLMPVYHLPPAGTRLASADVSGSLRDYVITHRSRFGLSDQDDLQVKSLKQDRGGFTHLRLTQVYRDVPVFGGELVVHSRGQEIFLVNGNLLQGIDLNTEPDILAVDALKIGQEWFLTQVAGRMSARDFIFERETDRLTVFRSQDGKAHLAWQVSFFTELQHGVKPGLWNVFVDAKSGDVIFGINVIDTLEQASGPGGTPNHAHEWVEELDVEDTATPGVYEMDTTQLRTTNLNGATSGSGTIVTGPLVGIGDAPINNAHGHTEIALLMFTEMGHPDSIDDAGFKLISRVHYGTGYDNAFWDGTQMTYGDGDTLFWPLSGALDVVAHEISHGFTEFHSGLDYWNEPGGLNEGFSDIGGTIAEFIYEGAGANWDMGEDISQAGTALRFMCDPTADGESIDHYDDYYDWIDVHYSSGILNKAFCRIAKRYASGDPDGAATVDSVKRAGMAFFKANDSYWVSSSSFEQSCQGVVAAANELGYSQQEMDWIIESYLDVGVYCYGAPLTCDVTYTADSGQFSTPNYPNDYPNDHTYTWCVEPGGGKEVTLHFEDFSTESNYDYVSVYDANEVLLSYTSGPTAPSDATSTKIFVRFESDGSVTDRGFLASWTSSGGVTCDQTFTADSGQFTSPNYPGNYPANVEQVWCIQPAGGQDTVLHFPDFNTQSGSDYVTVFDADLSQISDTSGSTPPPLAISTGFAVRFTSDASGSDSGFVAEWFAKLGPGEDCSADEMCLSDHCIDDVCCSTDCNSECYACNVAGHLGTCYPVSGGTPCGDGSDTECSNPDTCDGAGTCQANHASSGSSCGDQGVECLEDDTCDGSGNCTNNGYSPGGTACGDSSDSECDDPDTCNGQGSCQPNPASSGTACGDQGVECLADDTCDGSGNCHDNGYSSDGTACGDGSDSPCDDPDTCNGAGACQPNYVSSGQPCGDQGIECRVDDTCDGAGSCSDNGYSPSGTACGDSSDTECTDPDSCDGSGTCLSNDANAGSPCGDQGVECLVDDSCNGSGMCTDNGYDPSGTSCGDPNDTDCTDPDTCNGQGTCQSNHVPAGVGCGDQGIDCLTDDTCDGEGVCADNGFAEPGTPCGDTADDDCTNPDSCDAEGSCLANHEPDGTACTDNQAFCDGAESCLEGSCVSAGDPCTSAETCNEETDTCVPTCGNGSITGNEACDDGNDQSGDGCSDACEIEAGWTCTGEPSTCTQLPVCGDGSIDDGETCDDGNQSSGDGCSDACAVEEGWSCTGEPSVCNEMVSCGDGSIDEGEQCDDGNLSAGDGCSDACQVETGWTCTGEPSVCTEDEADVGGGGCGCTAPGTGGHNQALLSLLVGLAFASVLRRHRKKTDTE